MTRRLTFIVSIASIAFIIFAWSFLWLSEIDFSKAEGESYIVAGMENCYRAEVQKKCMEDFSEDLLSRFSIPEILTVFRAHESEEAFFNTCHEQAHYLGREAYKRIGSVAKIYAESNETCLGGVFHGALEGYFIEKKLVLGDGNTEKLKSAVANICDEVEAETPHSFTQCHHGLGHALMFAAEDRLPAALSLCDALSIRAYQEGCYTGAFMQNVTNAHSKDHPNAMLKDDDPLYPCPVLPVQHQPTCYTYAVLERYQGDVPKGIELCGMIPENLRLECFRTLGRNTVMYSDNVEVIFRECGEIPNVEYREACIIAAAGSILVRYELDSTLALELCSLMESGAKKDCYLSVGGIARSLVVDKVLATRFCEAIKEEAYRMACKGENL